jgi:hypothetical protein
MRTARFCSVCGEQIKLRRGTFWPTRSFCARCSPRFRQARLLLVTLLTLSAAGGFLLGRHVTRRETFYFIGTPVDTQTTSGPRSEDARDSNSTAAEGRQPAAPADEPLAVCGARTKSGRPCQRKVRGGGYCWQHRGKKAAVTGR